ncbi:MAG TPA: type II toxin-antitoxin system VapC family toxin [Blastocatellia bacterium]|jgi:PIN domain nuclease of toxin-antitoxin system|nr:type II toxin-antitoxin system VapC family toxin [Blastocatellia bacterium]
MRAVVSDTHAAIWYIVDPERLSLNARASFEQTALAGGAIYVSSISVVEMCYLVEKGRLSNIVMQRLVYALGDPASALVIFPLDLKIALAVEQIARSSVPDMPDRIIAATALHLNLPLITRDRRIQAAGVTTIW